MPFNISSFVNSLADGVMKSPFTISVLRNPICTALMMSAAIFIVILVIFSHADQGANLLSLSGRAIFWVFLIICGLLFVNNKILMNEIHEKTISGEYEGIIGESLTGVHDNIVPVRIQTMNLEAV